MHVTKGMGKESLRMKWGCVLWSPWRNLCFLRPRTYQTEL